MYSDYPKNLYFRKNDIIDTVTSFVQSGKILGSARPTGRATRSRIAQYFSRLYSAYNSIL